MSKIFISLSFVLCYYFTIKSFYKRIPMQRKTPSHTTNKTQISVAEVESLKQLKRESGFVHQSQNEDMLKYKYMQAGDMRSLQAHRMTFVPEMQGCLSKDPVKNFRYLLIVATGLASRFAVEGGLDLETAYSISDLYIQRADELNTANELIALSDSMFIHYTREMEKLRKKKAIPRAIHQCIDYIHSHLNEKLSLSSLASETSLSPAYLATLFKKEMQQTIGEYITNARIESAKNMLNHSDLTYSQISSALGFSSQSHFTKVFREHTGYTPRNYRIQFYTSEFV